jgi:hypothetical protein
VLRAGGYTARGAREALVSELVHGGALVRTVDLHGDRRAVFADHAQVKAGR